MGVGQDCRNHNLALLNHTKHRKKQLLWPIRWTLVCGVLLFVVGLVSLCIGHVVSDQEWYSHRFIKRSWYYKMVLNFNLFCMILCFLS